MQREQVVDFYTVAKGYIKSTDMSLFDQVAQIIAGLPNLVFDPSDTDWGETNNQLSCHLLCKGLAAHLPVECVDGHFSRSYEHSWLLTKSRECIIDAYPVAGAASFIVATDCSPWRHLYKPSSKLQGMFAEPEFKRRLDVTIREVGIVARELNITSKAA